MSADSHEQLASYRRLRERLDARWPEFRQRHGERLAQARRLEHGAAERVAEQILEDLFTGPLDWGLADVNYQVDYARHRPHPPRGPPPDRRGEAAGRPRVEPSVGRGRAHAGCRLRAPSEGRLDRRERRAHAVRGRRHRGWPARPDVHLTRGRSTGHEPLVAERRRDLSTVDGPRAPVRAPPARADRGPRDERVSLSSPPPEVRPPGDLLRLRRRPGRSAHLALPVPAGRRLDRHGPTPEGDRGPAFELPRNTRDRRSGSGGPGRARPAWRGRPVDRPATGPGAAHPAPAYVVLAHALDQLGRLGELEA